MFSTSAHSDPGTPQSGPGTPHSGLGTPHTDGDASGQEIQSDDEKWDGGGKSDQSEDEEEKRHYSDEERENSDDEGPRHRKPGTPRFYSKDILKYLYHGLPYSIILDVLCRISTVMCTLYSTHILWVSTEKSYLLPGATFLYLLLQYSQKK